MPDLYTPSTITNNWSQLPYEAMAQAIAASGTAYNNNLETMSNLETKIAEMKKLKTFDELQPDLQNQLGSYSDKINQMTSTLANNPNLYISAGPQLKRLGLEISRDINTGNISNYVNAYRNWQESYKKDLEDPKKSQIDVNAVYTSNRKKIIEALQQGKDPSVFSVPDDIKMGETLKKWAEGFKPTMIKNADGTSVEQINEGDFKSHLRHLGYTDSSFNTYKSIMGQADPEHYGLQVARDNSGNPKVNPTTGKPIYIGRVRDSKGNLTNKIGETENQNDAISGFDQMLESAINNEWLAYSGAKIDNRPEKGKDDPSGSKGIASGIYVNGTSDLSGGVGGSVKNGDVSKIEVPEFVPWSKGPKMEYDKLIARSRNSSLTQSQRDDAKHQADVLLDSHNNQAEIVKHARELAERDLVAMGKRTRDNNGRSYLSSENVEYFRKRADDLKGRYQGAIRSNSSDFKSRAFQFGNINGSKPTESSTFNPHEYSRAVDDYHNIKQLNNDFNSLYQKHYRQLYGEQRNSTHALAISGSIQQEIANIVENEKGTVEAFDEKGKKSSDNATQILDSIKNNKYLTKYSFETIRPTESGTGLEIRVLDKDSKKTTTLVINSPDAVKGIQQHLLNEKSGATDEVRSYVSAMGDPQRMRVYNTVTKASMPTNNADFGPLTEVRYGNILVKFKKASNGSIRAQFIDRNNNKTVDHEFNSNNPNGELVNMLVKLSSYGLNNIQQSQK